MNTKDLTKILLAQAESQVRALEHFQRAYNLMAAHYNGEDFESIHLGYLELAEGVAAQKVSARHVMKLLQDELGPKISVPVEFPLGAA